MINIFLFPFCRQGSVIAESIAEYEYENNETQIQFINTELQSVLTDILNDTSNLNTIAQAFGPNVSAQLNEVTFQPTEIKSEYPTEYVI